MSAPSQGDATRPHDPGTVDDLLELLADAERRRLLLALAEPEGDADARLADADGSTRSHYRHVHLPKLDDAHVIEWEKGTDSVEKGPRFDRTEALLQAVVDSTGLGDRAG